jgi:DNA-binding MarR family transcriptional regulator
MSSERHRPVTTLCLWDALRPASPAVSRLYDRELRRVGLRTTHYSLLARLSYAREVRQRVLGGLTSLDETTLAGNVRPLMEAVWVAISPGEDRREKLVRLTADGAAKLKEARRRGSGPRNACDRACRSDGVRRPASFPRTEPLGRHPVINLGLILAYARLLPSTTALRAETGARGIAADLLRCTAGVEDPARRTPRHAQ